MGNTLKGYIKYIVLIIIFVVLIHIIYFQSKEINELKIINNELKIRTDSAFMFIFLSSDKSIKLAESLEQLSYIEPDAHYNEYKDLFKKALEDLSEWKSESNQLISLGIDSTLSSFESRYHSTTIYNVVNLYRAANISPADFSKEWRTTLQSTANLLRSLNKDMDSIRNSSMMYMNKNDFVKRKVTNIAKEYLDDIYRINNIEYERLQIQVRELVKKD
ncbi:hypothetical protein R9X47_26645 [Wukongibacter baidiensis]|uniref:hypothetical protein n=1 Tax=Wukongibacter baidiensis TaxID=1723361 RepID=UPI003D7F9A33